MNESNTYKRQIQIVFKNSGQGTLSTGTNDHTHFLQRPSHTLQFISFHVAKTGRKIKVYSISSQVPQLVKTLGEEREVSEGDLGSIPGLGRSPGKGNGYPLQYLVLENSMDYVHGVTKSQTQLSYFHFFY